MTDKVQKIREFLVGIADADGVSTILAKSIEKKILPYIDSLQEEPVSEDLEGAAMKYATKEYYKKEPSSLPPRCVGCYAPLMYAFKAGAEWGKNQAMAEIQAQSMALAH